MNAYANCMKGWIDNAEKDTDAGRRRSISYRGRSMVRTGTAGAGVELSEAFDTALDIIEKDLLPL